MPEGSLTRRLPLIVGIGGGCLLMANRLLFTPDLLNSQSRSDALGILLSALLILTGLLWQEVQLAIPQSVELEGVEGFELDPELSAAEKLELGWISHTLLTATAARSIVIWVRGKVLLRRGILTFPSSTLELQLGSILQRVLQTGKSVYLVDLKLFPARAEFTAFLPANTQAVLCQPLGDHGVLIVGSDTPRSITKRDQVWIEAMAQKLDNVLSQNT